MTILIKPILVKLGGSLLTDKRGQEEPRTEVIRRIAGEIQRARLDRPDLQIVLGHGSGSFGHLYASRYGTRKGVATEAEWFGFAQTADAAARLNRIVITELLAAGIPAWSVQPSVALRCRDGYVIEGPESTLSLALARGLVPVIFGDVALDDVRGGTIASTEEIFESLDTTLQPDKIILAGEVGGIYTGDPLLDASVQLIPLVTPHSFNGVKAGLGGSHGVDVTGGMAAKVAQVLDWIEKWPNVKVLICSGLEPDNLYHALIGEPNAVGSWLKADE